MSGWTRVHSIWLPVHLLLQGCPVLGERPKEPRQKAVPPTAQLGIPMPCHTVAAFPAAAEQWLFPAHGSVGLPDRAHCCAPCLPWQSSPSPTEPIAMWVYPKPAHISITRVRQ